MFSAIYSKAVNKTCWAILTFKAARLFLFQEAVLGAESWLWTKDKAILTVAASGVEVLTGLAGTAM